MSESGEGFSETQPLHDSTAFQDSVVIRPPMVRLSRSKVLNGGLRSHRGFPERTECQADEGTKRRRGRLIRVQRHPLHTGRDQPPASANNQQPQSTTACLHGYPR